MGLGDGVRVGVLVEVGVGLGVFGGVASGELVKVGEGSGDGVIGTGVSVGDSCADKTSAWAGAAALDFPDIFKPLFTAIYPIPLAPTIKRIPRTISVFFTKLVIAAEYGSLGSKTGFLFI